MNKLIKTIKNVDDKIIIDTIFNLILYKKIGVQSQEFNKKMKVQQ